MSGASIDPTIYCWHTQAQGDALYRSHGWPICLERWWYISSRMLSDIKSGRANDGLRDV